MDNDIKDYRNFIITAEQKSQEAYDKTVISLSGGALGISFAFIKDIVGPDTIFCTKLLFFSWLCWSLSITCVLVSYYTSQLSLRKTIKQIDNSTYNSSRVGGVADIFTIIFNAFSGLLFLTGVILISYFVEINLGD